MQTSLDSLIQKIKNDGIAEAQRQADTVRADAEKQARQILEQARRQAEELIEQATEQGKRLRQNGEEALKQAARDVMLALRQQMVALFDRILRQEIQKSLSAELVSQLVLSLVAQFRREKPVDIEVVLAKGYGDALIQRLTQLFREKALSGITVTVSPAIESGLRIGEKDKGFYYDITDDALAEIFQQYLNPRIRAILTGEAGDGV